MPICPKQALPIPKVYTQLQKTYRYILVAAALCLQAANSSAQVENTVEDWSWKVDHFERFGIWDSVCDYRDDNGTKLQRCYVSHVDVFAPRPKFAAAFMFVTPEENNSLKFEFRFETGTQFDEGGFAVLVDDQPIWDFNPANCPSLKCIFEGAEAKTLLNSMEEKGELYFALTDRYGRHHELQWNTEGFAEAITDMKAQSVARNLF